MQLNMNHDEEDAEFATIEDHSTVYLEENHRSKSEMENVSIAYQGPTPSFNKKQKPRKSFSTFQRIVTGLKKFLLTKSKSQDLSDQDLAKEDPNNKKLDIWTEPLKVDLETVKNDDANTEEDIVFSDTGLANRLRCDTFDRKGNNQARGSARSAMKRLNKLHAQKSVDFIRAPCLSPAKGVVKRTRSFTMNIETPEDNKVSSLFSGEEKPKAHATLDRRKLVSYVENRGSRLYEGTSMLRRSFSMDEELTRIRNEMRQIKESNLFKSLSAEKKIRFYSIVTVAEVENWDRRIQKTWAYLTEGEKERIKKELNMFKELEMNVHEESKKYTRFHY